jgi:predicted transcriptional regulator
MVQQQQIRVWRARLGITQEELAREAALNQARISRAEHGMVRLRDEEMARIHAYLMRKRDDKSTRKASV